MANIRPPKRSEMVLRRVPEPFVWWLWEHRRAGSTVSTTDGRQVQVIYPGRRWGNWGPDFRGALLAIDGVLVRGDVEVHVRAQDWVAHGHADDPEYLGMALHVLFEAPAGPSAPSIATAALAPALSGSLGDLLAEWESAPDPAPTIPCRSPTEAADLLARAGLARFEAKAARFEGDLTAESPAVSLLAGALECLGYSANVSPMRRLLARLPVGHLLDLAATEGERQLAAALYGEAGLLPCQRGRLPLDDDTLEIERVWRRSGRPGPRDSLGWRWRGCRPANTPVRRLAAGLATLAGDGERLDQLVVGALTELPPAHASRALQSLIVRPGDAYWQGHADFGRPLGRPAAVLGSQRAADIVVNALLPWALALARSTADPTLERAATDAYRAHPPLADNQVTRHMAQQIVGSDGARTLRTACLQQGLIHIYQGWCDARDCMQCPAGAGAPLPLW